MSFGSLFASKSGGAPPIRGKASRRRTHRPRCGQFESDLASGVAVLVPCNFADVLRRAEELSQRHTITGGHRSFDVLHAATALHLGARELLSFDGNQQALAQAEGLKAKP